MSTHPVLHVHGADIPRLGFGTFTLEGDTCARAVVTALAAGYRHLDTASMYGNETAVGEGLRASGLPRGSVFVTTKVWRDDIAPGALERSAEASLKRLGLSQVDLLLIHWPNEAVPLKESTAALCRAKRQGLARHVGVSNYPVAMLDEAWRHASEPLVTNQVEYHPYLDQSAVREACRRHGMAVTAYCPLGRQAVLADPAVARIAARHGRTPAQVVLRWHLQQADVIAIPKSAHADRIRENAEAADVQLTDDEVAAISALAKPNGRVIDPSFAPRWDAAA